MALFVGLLSGCLAQDVVTEAPLVEPRLVTIRVLPDSEVVGSMAPLGWMSGIPDVDVIVRSADSEQSLVDSGRTDAEGRITVGPLLPSQYVISLLRVLTDSERRQLPIETSLEGFALEGVVALGRADTTAVRALAATRGSVLTSEFFFAQGYYNGYPYSTGGYWELYNNSDTTIYLDAMILAEGRAQGIETNPMSCAESESRFQPPDGVWTFRLDRFPGSGREYPLRPGEVALVAGYAIDHSQYFQNALNLSRADFEFGSPEGTNNPDVPNLVWLGLERRRAGELFSSVYNVPVIVTPLDTSGLPRQWSPGTVPTQYRQVPAATILEVFAWRYYQSFSTTPCRRMVHPNFTIDIEIGGVGPDAFLVSTNRRVLYTKPDGRKILLHTRSSRTDFVDGPRTPGFIP